MVLNKEVARDSKYQGLRGIPGKCQVEMFELLLGSEVGSGRKARSRDIRDQIYGSAVGMWACGIIRLQLFVTDRQLS